MLSLENIAPTSTALQYDATNDSGTAFHILPRPAGSGSDLTAFDLSGEWTFVDGVTQANARVFWEPTAAFPYTIQNQNNGSQILSAFKAERRKITFQGGGTGSLLASQGSIVISGTQFLTKSGPGAIAAHFPTTWPLTTQASGTT